MWENVRKAVASVLVFAVLLANMGENIFASELSDDIVDAEVTSEETEPEMMDAELEEAELGTEILELETEEEGVGTEFDELDVMQTQDMDDTVYINEIEKAESENGLEEEELEKKSYGSNVEWKWDESSKTLTFSGEGEVDQYNFPDEYKETVEHIIVDPEITEAGYDTFNDCTNLQTVEALGIARIGNRMCWNCKKLTEVKIPFVCEMGDDAFYECENLTAIDFPLLEEIGSSAFNYCKSLETINLPSIKKIEDGAFSGCDSSKLCKQNGMLILANTLCLANIDVLPENLVIPENVTQIHSYVFRNFSKLKSVQAQGLKKIEYHCFEGCAGLESVQAPVLETVEEGAFESCTALCNADGMIIINNILCAINKKGLEKIVLPDDVKKIGNALFGGWDLKEIQGNNVIEVGVSSFQGCENLFTVNFPNLTEIKEEAFKGCKSLQTVNFPKLQKLGYRTFYDCAALAVVDVSSLEYLGGGAFTNCINLKKENVKIPQELDGNVKKGLESGSASGIFENTQIDYMVFNGRVHVENYELLPEELILPEEVTFIGSYDFSSSCKITKIVAPGLLEVDEIAFDYNQYLTTVIAPKLETIGWKGFSNCDNLVIFEAPNLKSIGIWAFGSCENLTVFEAPNVEKVGDYAFTYDTKLIDSNGLLIIGKVLCDVDYRKIGDNMVVPEGVAKIAIGAVSGRTISLPSTLELYDDLHEALSNTSLKEITVSSENPYLQVKNGLLLNKTGTKLIVCPPQKSDNVCDIPDSVNTIGFAAISGCAYSMKVIVPASVKTVEKYGLTKRIDARFDDVFYNSGDFYFYGDVPEWYRDDGDKLCYEPNDPPKEECSLTIHYKKGTKGWEEMANKYPLVKFVVMEENTETENPGNTTPDINNQQNIKIQKIKLTAPSAKLAAGKKVKLTATISPANAVNKSLKWTTSNKKYATVDKKGNVTLKSAGAGKKVTITATAKDGSKKKAAYKITIMKHAVKSVKIKASTKSIKAGKSLQLKTVIKTSGKKVNKTLAWSTSNKKYATVDKKGKVKTKKAGKGKRVTITAKSTDGTNKKATIKLKIK